MNFTCSTQARSWLFDEESLEECRKKAAADASESSRVRKFASGFHSRYNRETVDATTKVPSTPMMNLSPSDKEMLVQFHAHQIQALVGPDALLTALRTSETVLSTAVMFFRRYYLSNSIVDSPRKIAAACAFFAAKCEDELVPIGLVAHATALVHLRVQNAPLCRHELCSVSVSDIEQAERDLMEGLNYEFRCYHPVSAISVLATDFPKFLSSKKGFFGLDFRNPSDSYDRGDRSPTTALDSPLDYEDKADEIYERALEISRRAMVFSDVPFLFAPGQIGFAIVAIAAQAVDSHGRMDDDMQDYLVSRFPLMTEEEMLHFSRQVSRIAQTLLNCPSMDLSMDSDDSQQSVAERAEDLRRVFAEVANLRLLRQMHSAPPQTHRLKRSRRLDVDFTPPRERFYRKLARVTPTGQQY